MATFLRTTPLLVADEALSTTITTDPITGEPAVRVVDGGGGGGSSSWTPEQAAQVVETVGTPDDPDTMNTVIGLLKRILNK